MSHVMQCAQWLESLDGLSNVYPVTLQLGKKTFQAVHYVQNNNERFYVLCENGNMPPMYWHKNNVHFLIDGQPAYIMGWYPPKLLSNTHWADRITDNRYDVYHPFGPHFELSILDNAFTRQNPIVKGTILGGGFIG